MRFVKYLCLPLVVASVVASDCSSDKASDASTGSPRPTVVIDDSVLRTADIVSNFRLVERPVRKVANADLYAHLCPLKKEGTTPEKK